LGRRSGICTPNLNSLALIVSEISAFIRTDGQKNMARSTRLVILIKNIYTLCGRKRYLLPVAYFPTNLVYPLTLQVTGIKRESNIKKKRVSAAEASRLRKILAKLQQPLATLKPRLKPRRKTERKLCNFW